MGLSKKDIRDFCRIVFLCIFWYIVSSANGVFGKWILSEFAHPMTLTMIQLLSITVYSRPMLALLGVRGRNGEIPKGFYKSMIIPLAFAKFISSVMAHVSIWKVPVSYAHTVKASMPFFTVIFSRVLLGDRYPWKVYACLVPIIGGVAIATVTEVSFDITGLGSALAATAGFSIMNIFSKKTLKETGIHHLRLLLILGQMALVMFLPVWCYSDLGYLLNYKQDENSSINIFFLLIVDGILHWMQNILAFTILKLVAPLTYAVANVTKRISVITASLLLLKNPVTFTNMGGMLMAISGVFLYNKVKYDENQRLKTLPSTNLEAVKLNGSSNYAKSSYNNYPQAANTTSLWNNNGAPSESFVKLATPMNYAHNSNGYTNYNGYYSNRM